MAKLTRTITTIALFLAAPYALADANEDILRRYVEDYRSDPMLVDTRFGIKVGEQWWSVASHKGAQGQPNEVVLSSGQPAQPTWFYSIENADYLRRLDRGEVAFGTLAGKARQSDKVPVDADFMRTIHGADSTALYYQPGLRTIWFSLKNGQHANRNKGEGVGPWTKLLIFVSGAGKARIGERTVDVQAGDRVFVPPHAVNEVWNDSTSALEGVLIIFGEGA